MNYKLIALDIDGTIRSPDYPLSERTKETLARVTETGAHVTLATGRMFRAALDSTRGLSLRSPIASFQGAHVADPITGEVLWHKPLKSSMTREALCVIDPWELEVMAYHNDQVYIRELTPRLKSYGERNNVVVHAVGDFATIADLEFTRLVVSGDENQIELLETYLQAQFGSSLYVTRSLPYFCEILHPDGGKDKALEWICEYLGIDRCETIAFGNGYNDVQMIQWAHLGVAVEGAVPGVIEVADSTVPPLEEDGVAQLLEDLLAKGLIG